MAKNNTEGWYTFEDGFQIWVRGMDARYKRNLIIDHGKIVSYKATRMF